LIRRRGPPAVSVAAAACRRWRTTLHRRPTEGARDAWVLMDPRASFASRQRGMPMPNVPAAGFLQSWAVHAARPGRPARGVYRLAPQRAPEVERFTRRRRDLPPRTGPDCAPLTGARPGRQDPPRQRRRRGGLCGLDRRALPAHLRCKGNSRPPLPAPRLETLIRHPSVTRAG
jgi:hypothetical protein